MKNVYIGGKKDGKYVSAATYDFGRDDVVVLHARGKSYIGKAVNVARRLIRKLDLDYDITIKDKKFHDEDLDKDRIVSVMKIELVNNAK